RNSGSRLSETDLHAAPTIAVRGFCDPRAGEGRVRTLGCMRGARRRRCWRGHGRAHAGAVRAGKIRRRLDEGNETKLPRLSGTTEELLELVNKWIWKRVLGRARLQPCHYRPIKMRALAPEGRALRAERRLSETSAVSHKVRGM